VHVCRHIEDAIGGVIKIGGLSEYDPWEDSRTIYTEDVPLIIVDVASSGEELESQAEELATIQRTHQGRSGAR
jgi:hypothetical protein